MSRSSYAGPKLPKLLLDQVQTGRVKKPHQQSRKERRQSERAQKKPGPSKPAVSRKPLRPVKHEESVDDDKTEDQARTAALPKDVKPLKSILKAERRPPSAVTTVAEDDAPSAPTVSKTVKARLEADDAEIARLEKKLGISKRKSKKSDDDGLDWLLEGGSDSDEGDALSSVKRKRPDDVKWLQDKRRNAQRSAPEREHDADEDEEEQDTELETPFSEDEFSAEDGTADETSEADEAGDFEEFEDEPDEVSVPKRQRENPYVAPVVRDSLPVAKYIPPSRRQPATSDEEMLKQLKRQLQGLLNRLSEANLMSILQGVEQIYANNARQHVTATLVDLLEGLIADPSVLSESFLVVHAGFVAAVYKIMGVDFAAHLLEHFVAAFDKFHNQPSTGKQTLNLLAFLSHLYALQAIGCEILFDYIRILLDNFSEANTELLLRVIRTSGPQLRQDDPTALKDIVLLLQRSVANLGQDNLSVRTKFMIETIQDLKNNRMKTGQAASALAADHLQRMKRTLGSIAQAGRGVKATDPLRITLADIRDTEKKGKWWLVGASWRDPAKMVNGDSQTNISARQELDEDHTADGHDDNEVDLNRLAREQGMNTDIRRAIFISVAGAVDFKHAYERILKLKLKSKQQLEIPRVILHCAGVEPVYNHFYTLVAMKFCADHKLRKAWEFALLDLYRRMGEDQDEADAESDDDNGNQTPLGVTKIYNTAKLYASLVAEELLRITVLKTLDFASLHSKTRIFVETLLANLFVLLRRKRHKAGFEDAVKHVFSQATADMAPGLQFYITEHMPRTEVVANKEKERKLVSTGCEVALETLNDVRQGRLTNMSEDSDDTNDD